MAEPSYKTCPCCGKAWNSRSQFLADKRIVLEGYSVNFEDVEQGQLLFVHQVPYCGSRLEMSAGQFLDLYGGPRYAKPKVMTAVCPRYCKDPNQLSRCTAKCQYACVREVLATIRGRFVGECLSAGVP